MDDDVNLQVVNIESRENPWRLVENFLLRIQPPIAALDTSDWNFVGRIFKLRKDYDCVIEPTLDYMPAVWFDGMFNIFHHEAVEIVLKPLLPLWERYDARSWWFSQWYVCILSDIVYHSRVVHSVKLMSYNPAHRPYAWQWCDPAIIDSILADIRTVIPIKLVKSADILLNIWRNEYEQRRRGEHTFCLEPPRPGCSKPYDYVKNLTG